MIEKGENLSIQLEEANMVLAQNEPVYNEFLLRSLKLA